MPYPRQLILASGSPRRRELLVEWGYAFEVVVPSEGAEGGALAGETPSETVARLAQQKAADVALRFQSGLILACDTLAECQGEPLGKPRDIEHARQMLRLLSGQRHSVYSGVCLWELPSGKSQVRVDRTVLEMDALADQQLEDYLAGGQWQGKAGAFGFQDGLDWVHILEGSPSNVVGLPMELLEQMLSDWDAE